MSIRNFNTTTNAIDSNGWYATNEFVDCYLYETKGQSGYDVWEALSEDNQDAFIVRAQDIINSLDWKGSPVSDTQAQVFPRKDLITRVGGDYTYSDGTNDLVPVEVAQAIAETAVWLAEENRESQEYYEAVSLDGVGEVKTNAKAKNVIPRSVWRLCKHLLRSTGNQPIIYRV